MAHLWHGHRTSALNLFGVSRTQQEKLPFGKNLPMRTTRSTQNTVAGSTGDAALLAVHGEPRRIRRARTVWPRQSRRQMAVTVTQWPPICESIRAWSVAEPLLLDGRVTVLGWRPRQQYEPSRAHRLWWKGTCSGRAWHDGLHCQAYEGIRDYPCWGPEAITWSMLPLEIWSCGQTRHR